MKMNEPSQTAIRVAFTRAVEALLPAKKRLCFDDAAKHFLDPRLTRCLNSLLLRNLFRFKSDFFLPGVWGAVLIRTRLIDDTLAESIASGTQQVVILGAGYDTRGIRFGLADKDIPVFEVDHPATQKRKLDVIRQLENPSAEKITYVPVRFNSQDMGEQLYASGYRNDLRTLFIWEGVTYYISKPAVVKTLDFTVKHSPKGSSIIFDYFPESVVDGTSPSRTARTMHAFFDRLGESIAFGINPENIGPFLTSRGFESVSLHTASALKHRYLKGINRRLHVSEIFYFAHATV